MALLLIIGALRWAIVLVMLLFLLGPLALDYLGAKRDNAAADFMYEGRTYVRTLAAPTINSYVPVQYGGKDRC